MLLRKFPWLVLFLAACQAAPVSQPSAFDSTFAKASAGDKVAQNELARFYHYEQGPGREDYGAAFQWYQKAAQQGVNEAQSNLAYLYAEGKGTPQDLRKAWAWYSIAAVEKNPLAATKRDEVAKKLSKKELAEAKLELEALKKQLVQ